MEEKQTNSIEDQQKDRKWTLIGKILFTQVGLFVLVCSYCVGGAYLFQSIEYSHIEEKHESIRNNSYEIESQRVRLAKNLWKYKRQKNFNKTIRNLIKEYHKNISDLIVSTDKYVGNPLTKTDLMNGWVFSSSLLFTITILTTIGYGTPSPKTSAGQLTTIFYAMIGVPLMLMFLANVGDAMAKFFRIAYGRGCCYCCWKKRKQNYELNKLRLLAIREHGKAFIIHDDLVDFEDKYYLDQIDYTKILEDLKKAKINVPISLTLVVIAAYVYVGAVLFASWNQWSWIKGAYFSFITLSTIGFGDVLPGLNEVGTTNRDLKMAVSVAYTVVGLAVLSMSFNLMMEEMFSKFKWVGTKLGIVDPEKKMLLNNHESLTDRSFDSEP